MSANADLSLEGGCTCRAVRYRMTSAPLFVHCCHCRWCQRETGAAFALNAMIESDRVVLLTGSPEPNMGSGCDMRLLTGSCGPADASGSRCGVT